MPFAYFNYPTIIIRVEWRLCHWTVSVILYRLFISHLVVKQRFVMEVEELHLNAMHGFG